MLVALHRWVSWAAAITGVLFIATGCRPDEPGFAQVPDPQDDDSAADDDSEEPSDYAPVSGLTVVVHPDVVTLLLVSWVQDEDAALAWVEFTFGDDERHTPVRDGMAGDHQAVLLGIPGETEVTIRVVNTFGEERRVSEAATATTGAIPGELPHPHLISWDPDAASSAHWLFTSIEPNYGDWYEGPWWLVVLDRQARIVWYYAVPGNRCTMHSRVALDGTHLLFEETSLYQGDYGADSVVRRMTLDMAYLETLEIPGLGSTFAETTDDSILFDDYSDWPTTALAELHSDGTRTTVWNCSLWGSIYGLSQWDCDPNETVWVEHTDTVLWSMWACDTVVEVARDTGELLRTWGALEGSWDFDPPEAMFDMQHYPHYTTGGTLLVSSHVVGESWQQRAREFVVDEPSQTLSEIWSYGEGTGQYATYAGEAFRLDNGNTFINYGTMSNLREVTPDKEIAWEAGWDNRYLIGHVSLLEDLYAVNVGR